MKPLTISHDVQLDTTKGRLRLVESGSLQIVGTEFLDTGLYTCEADNGLSHPDTREIDLQISGTLHLPTLIVLR